MIIFTLIFYFWDFWKYLLFFYIFVIIQFIIQLLNTYNHPKHTYNNTITPLGPLCTLRPNSLPLLFFSLVSSKSSWKGPPSPFTLYGPPPQPLNPLFLTFFILLVQRKFIINDVTQISPCPLQWYSHLLCKNRDTWKLWLSSPLKSFTIPLNNLL